MGSMKAKARSAQVRVADPFRPMTEYVIDPLEMTAIGLMLGPHKLDKARLAAKERALQEFAIIGNSSVRVMLRPPADMRPPEPWLHEWVKPKYLAQAREIISNDD